MYIFLGEVIYAKIKISISTTDLPACYLTMTSWAYLSGWHTVHESSREEACQNVVRVFLTLKAVDQLQRFRNHQENWEHPQTDTVWAVWVNDLKLFLARPNVQDFALLMTYHHIVHIWIWDMSRIAYHSVCYDSCIALLTTALIYWRAAKNYHKTTEMNAASLCKGNKWHKI